MRATINFEVDVDQVENTMATLVAMESDTLRAIADMIDVNPGPRTMVLEEVTEALRLLGETSAQLEQYRGMLLSFERARFETVLPQPSESLRENLADSLRSVRDSVQSMEEFDGFIDKMKGTDDDEDQEG